MMLKAVEKLDVSNRRDVERIIENVRGAGLKEVLVVGLDSNGELWTDINFADGASALWLLELVKAKLMASAFKKELGG